MHATHAEIWMRQMHEPEGWVHLLSIGVEAKEHHLVAMLDHKVNTQLLIHFIHDMDKLFVFFICDK